ncbi:MAG: type IV secretion system DNA-binding domain-containing protein [Patescibacteria group bacterium]
MSVNDLIYLVIFLIALIIIAFVVFLILERMKGRGRIVRALNMSLFLIKLPREEKKDISMDEKKSRIAVMEQLLSGFSNLTEKRFFKRLIYDKPYIVLEMAVPFSSPEISFYLAMPRKFESFVEKQIYGFYPKCSVEKIDDYNIFHPNGVSAGGYLKLEKNSILPLKTYKDLENDPLESLSNAFSKIDEKGEGGSIQIIIRPAEKNWNSLALSVAKRMNEGVDFNDAIKGKQKQSLKEGESPQKVSPMAEETIKSLQSKAGKPGFETNIRLVFSSEKKERSEELLSHAAGSFAQLGAPNINSLKLNKQDNRQFKKLCFNFSFRLFSLKEKMVLNSEEISSIFHFPLTQLSSPKMQWLEARDAEPPVNLPKQGVVLGKNDYRGEEQIVRMADEDRRRHMYIIGQTGTGKTTMMLNMIKQDIENGKGVAFMDPHGSDIENILENIPLERIEDVVYFDPSDIERPVGLNLLEYDPEHPEQKTFLANETINIFKKVWEGASADIFGPMFEQYMRNAILLIMDHPESGSTLLEVPKVLADASFRKYKLSKTENSVVKDFWQKEAEKAGGEAALANVVPYITSKTNVFLANDVVRPIICQQKSSINFRNIMDEKKILLVNLSKGKLGDVNSRLLGLIIVTKLLMAAFSRVDTPEKDRNDFYLYMDEFQNFTTDSVSTILAEARKYRLNLIIGHQFIGQLVDSIKNAVFGNVGSMVAYRVGAEDAEFLVKQFEPTFSQQDLINIDNFNAYVKLLINSQTSKPFNIKIGPPAEGDSDISKKAKEISRMKYGREKAVVDKEIQERSEIAEDLSVGATSLAEDVKFI